MASLGLGQVLPYLVFESLLIGKVYRVFTDYKKAGIAELQATYRISTVRSPSHIGTLIMLTQLVFFGCLLLWLGAVAYTAQLEPGESIAIPILLGGVNCLLAWFYVIFV